MRTISKMGFLAGAFLLLSEAKAQSGAAAYAYLSVKGVRGSSVTININGAESGKVLPGLSKLIPITKPGNFQVTLADDQGNRFDTTLVFAEKEANKTLSIRFPESASAVTATQVAVNPAATTAAKETIVSEQVMTGNSTDADDDGVPDHLDREPNTPRNAAVDVRGRAIDTDGDGVPDYKDKEKLTQTNCFPVNSTGIGNCPESASLKALSATLVKLEEKINAFEKQSRGGSNTSAALLQSVASSNPDKQSIEELKKLLGEITQLAAKAKDQAAVAELASVKAQSEAREAQLASDKAQNEMREAEQSSARAQSETQEATMASEKAQMEANEATQASQKAQNEAKEAEYASAKAQQSAVEASSAATKAKNAATKPVGKNVLPKQATETTARSNTIHVLRPEKILTTKK
jgi:hypothetical protein